ncbi:acyl-CoA dehydrogenase [Rhodococcoides yunnanense]|uniref:acyl-CoA dehydrogenase n=1 Tax=Rhodococcoides yunnanense TaxID=278209 RepID=UPI000934B783|nr:acyl-CoA dehydrogenase [Rhodococcus yunnanensis]
MDLRLTEDEQSVKDSFATLFEKEANRARGREKADEAFDSDLWKLLASLDTIGIATANDGGGAVVFALVAMELGRHVAAVPLIEAAVVARVLASFPEAAALAAEVTSGGKIATLATNPVVGGVAHQVVAGAVADVVVALDGEELVAVVSAPTTSARGDLGFLAVADRPLAGERLVLARGEQAQAAFADAVHLWRIGVAAALVGLGSRAVRIGVDYAKDRYQFGVPIGTFQAVQHGLADVATGVEGAELLVLEAAWSADQQRPEWTLLATMAFAQAAETAQAAASASLHYHGGYGVALEYEIHRYVRRAKGWTLAGGDPDDLWQHIGRQYLDTQAGR